MKHISFSNGSELEILQNVLQPVFERWNKNWVSSNANELKLQGELLHSLPKTKSWFSVRVNKGYLFFPHDEKAFINLASLVLGVGNDVANVILGKSVIKNIILKSIEELLFSFSNALGADFNQSLVETNKPELKFGSMNTGGYIFKFGQVEMVAEGAILELDTSREKVLYNLESSVEKTKVGAEVYLPSSKFEYGKIVNLKKGSVLITDAKVDNDLELRVSNKVYKSGSLAKRNDKLVLKISDRGC